MAETKWMPGPWFAERASDTVDSWAVKSNQCPAFFVAEAFRLGPPDSAEANARLIAAAPELYEALSDLMLLEAYCDHRKDGTLFDAARMVLAKAHGETS